MLIDYQILLTLAVLSSLAVVVLYALRHVQHRRRNDR